MSKCGSCQKLQGALYRDQPGDPTCSQGGQRSEANRSMNQSAVNAQSKNIVYNFYLTFEYSSRNPSKFKTLS